MPTSFDDLKEVLVPVANARGLPNKHYICPETFVAERDAVFSKNWAAVGFGKDIPDNGDLKPLEFLGIPLLLARGGDGEINVYQNTCRHRGMVLVNEDAKQKNIIRCPYHSWCYSLDGALITTPHVGGPGKNTDPHICREDLGLIKFRSHVWQDIIFVNLDGDAEPFEKVHADLRTRWAEFEKPLFHGGADSSFKLEIKCNWKLAVENYCESYHLPWVHPGLNSYSRLEDHYNIVESGKYSGQGTLVYNPDLGGGKTPFPNFDNLPSVWDKNAEYIALYPNVLLGVHRDHVFAIMLQPIDHENTIEHVEIYYAKPGAQQEGMRELREENTALWKSVFKEDIFVVEGMQKGRYGPNFDGGKFSPAMDEPTHTFHHWVASQMQSQRLERR